MVAVRDDQSRWFKRFGGAGPADVRLFCFHHAGGTAALYRAWPNLMPRFVEPIAVQLPGRADRLRERPFDAMSPLVDTLVEVLEPLLDQPFAFFGLSMGARVAWVLSHRLRDRAMPMPTALFVASTAAPEFREGLADWNVDDEVLIEYLRRMGGTPPELFAAPELLASLLPTLRADLTLVDTFRFRPETPLDVPIHAFAGIDDVEGSPERMSGWGAETSARFDLDVIPGGHFFDSEGERRVIRTVADDLLRELRAQSADVA
ncbi:MAG TPA: thioesterase domain-containing protein [Micromonosporaceae bacterium]